MKWMNRLLGSVAAVLVTAGGASASTPGYETPAEAAWSAAVRAGSLEAYAEFLLAYPDNEHAAEAYGRLTLSAVTPVESDGKADVAALWGVGQTGKSSPAILPGTIMII